jgi:alpha-beta hydrolase superfamily lysophospholipase
LAEPAIETFTASDGYPWRYRRFGIGGGDEPRRPTVVALHGIQSHGGWYLESCKRLADAGYDVAFLDRRGCGLNDRDRGDAPSFRRLLDDVAEYLATLPRPRFVMAISWGGKLAVALQRRHPNSCDGIVLIAPGLCPRVRPSMGERLRIIGARLVAPLRTFPIPLNDPELFTANAERRLFIHNDPLMLRRATARMLFESGRLDVYLRFAARCVTMPVLLLLAEQDRIIDNAATRRIVERFPATERSVMEYPGAHHTLEFEPGGPPFVDDVLKWLAERSPNR